MNTAFLNCNIWSVNDDSIPQDLYDIDFFLVSNIYYYNSLTSGILYFDINCIQIPEFEIQNLHLLHNLNFDLINKHTIPILCKINESWKIDLRIYEDFKLQPANI